MDPDNPALLALVSAVSDGTSVDWDSAGAGASDSFKKALVELRAIAEVANLHRSLNGETGREPVVSAPLHRLPPERALARWGHLHLLAHVASGAFGDVYRAWDPAIDREVALKLLRPQPHKQSGADETIEEGRLLARVRHPNVVTVYGAARVDGRVGIWMEFVHGRTLAALIQQDGPLPTGRVVDLGGTLCNAVAAVHDAGLLHRDIKAQNAMLADDGRVVLMDFGAGRPLDESTRDVAGTPLYLAPEIAAGQSATPRSDVYSLGVLLHFLATGAFPGAGFLPRRNDGATRVIHMGGAHAVLTPPALERIVCRATASDPDKRFGTAHDLGVALSELAEPVVIRRRPAMFVLAAVALAAGVVAAALPLRRALLTGAPAAPLTSAAGVIPDEEGLRKLPWRVAPTGPPSRDGRFMGAVDWDRATGAGLPALIDLATNSVRRLVEPPRAELQTGPYSLSSSIAPDGTRIAFSWSVPGPDAGELRVCALDGSALQTVYRDPRAEFRVVGWSAKEDEVLVLRTLASQPELVWVGVRDGRTRLALRLPSIPFVSLNPNGRDVVLDWPQSNAPEKRDLMIADTITGEIRPLLQAPADDAMPVWLPDGRHVLFASDRGGTFGAWLTDAEGAEPQQVRGSMGYWQPLGFGARGELYYLAQTGTVDVYTARLDWSARTVGPRQVIATSFQGRNLFSDWAPDGHRLAFTSRRGFGPGSEFLVLRDLGSTGERVVPTRFGDIGPPRWAPDGRRLASMRNDGGPDMSLLVLDIRSGRIEFSCRQSGQLSNLEWASNDRLWFIANGGSFATMREATVGSCATRELAREVSGFSLSRGRDQVALLSHTAGGITVSVARVDALDDRRNVLQSSGPGRLQLAGWTPDDEFIVAVGSVSTAGHPPGRWELLAIPSRGGPPMTVSLATVGDPPQHVRLSPDGSLISFEAGAPVITNWVLEHPLFNR